MNDLPDYYFRARENGAAVFRVETENRHHRIEMDQIATVNTRSGEIKPQGRRELSDADMQAIQSWLVRRMKLLVDRQLDDIARTVDDLNQTAHWAQSKASNDELEMVTDDLLMAMHDLRRVLVRKKADRTTSDQN